MPTEAANLCYKFLYAGGADATNNFVIDTENNTNYFVGGVMHDDTDQADGIPAAVYSDGNSNSKVTITAPEAGSYIQLWCEDGTTWYVSGTIYSITDTAFADQ